MGLTTAKRILLLFCFVGFSHAETENGTDDLGTLIREAKADSIKGCSNLDELQSLENLNPEDESRKAILEEDFRYLGLMGYSVIVPNIDYDFEACSLAPKADRQVRIIKGTSDYIACEEQKRLSEIAYNFSGKYNLLILKARKDRGVPTCSS